MDDNTFCPDVCNTALMDGCGWGRGNKDGGFLQVVLQPVVWKTVLSRTSVAIIRVTFLSSGLFWILLHLMVFTKKAYFNVTVYMLFMTFGEQTGFD